jgi:hypothetical protein
LRASNKRYSVCAVKQSDRDPRCPYLLARPETIISRAAEVGVVGDTAIARAFSVGRTTAWRVLHHRWPAPADFVAGALATLPHSDFEDLFEVVTPKET